MDRFSGELASCKSYQETDLLLSLMESRNPSSAEAANQAIGLLNSDEFRVARRAYWFLGDRTVSASQQKKLEALRLQHADRR